MGIVNLCHDSFCGDGLDDVAAAVKFARALVAEGAEIIDIGAESARTNRPAMAERDEAEKLRAFIEQWDEPVPLSINTWRHEVVRATLPRGGAILNDMGGLPDDRNARVCAETGAALLVMHTQGAPKVPQTHVRYENVMSALEAFFAEKIAVATAAGVAREAIVLDPGIDFAKPAADNLRILAELARLHQFARPILLPISRKTTIGEVLGVSDPRARDAGTVACIVHGMFAGAALFRVHNVRAASQTVRMISGIETSG
jgi:dihydropteroate synthase